MTRLPQTRRHLRRPLTPFDRRLGRDPRAWPFELRSPLAGQPRRTGPAGWPLPPKFSSEWGRRWALRLYRMMRVGVVDRFSQELLAILKNGVEGRREHSTTHKARVMAELGSYGYALRWEWKRRNEAFGYQFFRAAPDRYLGNPRVVRGLVNELVAATVASMRGDPNTTSVEELESQAVRIFAGQDYRYTTIGDWNTHAQLGGSAAFICNAPLARLGIRT